MKITVLTDNKPYIGRNIKLKNEWGLSLLIEYGGKKFLLDTGRSGAFAVNAKAMGCDIGSVDYGILSHGHFDHTDGLKTFFEINKSADFYMRKGLAENTYHKHWIFYEYIGIHKGWLKKFDSRIRYADGDYTVCPNVFLIPHKTPGLEKKGEAAHLSMKLNGKYQPDNFYHEQSLVFDTEKGLVIFNSCSHGGADNIVSEVESTFPGKKIYAILGGFHLFCLPDEAVLAFAKRLEKLGVERIVTGHCTGDHAYDILKGVLGDRVSQMYTGLAMEL